MIARIWTKPFDRTYSCFPHVRLHWIFTLLYLSICTYHCIFYQMYMYVSIRYWIVYKFCKLDNTFFYSQILDLNWLFIFQLSFYLNLKLIVCINKCFRRLLKDAYLNIITFSYLILFLFHYLVLANISNIIIWHHIHFWNVIKNIFYRRYLKYDCVTNIYELSVPNIGKLFKECTHDTHNDAAKCSEKVGVSNDFEFWTVKDRKIARNVEPLR